jgi:glycosyltransferase involved in cell wall biosynthesis
VAIPTVSVAMVVRNVERFLKEAIESILDQSLTDLEFNIVDFGSTDGTKEIVTSYAAKDVRIKVHEIPPCGLGDARNESCSLARAPYIAIMDADDIAVRDRLMWQVEYLEAHPRIGVLGGAVEVIEGHGNKLGLRRFPSDNEQLQAALLTDHIPLVHASLVMRRDVYVSAGGYRQPFAPAEDYDLWLRIAERSELANLDAVLLKYRVHPKQESYRHLRQMVLGTIASRAAARCRRKGLPDPLISAEEITLEVLSRLGVADGEFENTLLLGYQERIKGSLARKYDVSILQAVSEMLELLKQSKCVRDFVAAEVWFAAARAYSKERRYFSAAASFIKAFIHHPPLLADLSRRAARRLLRTTGRGPRRREEIA